MSTATKPDATVSAFRMGRSARRYTPITDADLEVMLGAIGAGSVEELFADIPESVRLQREIDVDRYNPTIRAKILFQHYA